MSQDRKVITAEEYQKIWADVQAMSPEERDALQAALMDKLARRRRVELDGKATSLKRLERQVEEQRRLFEAGAFDPTHRSMPRWQQHLCIPGQALRPGAYKQQLRWWEEAELELDRFGQGAVYSPRPVVGMLGGGRRDFAWGIYARTEQAEQVLGKRWARRSARRAVTDRELYLDVLRNCLNMELTLMVVTSRPLPLADMQAAMAAKLERSMQALSGGGELPAPERAALQSFVRAFDDERVAPAGWMDAKRGCIKPDTHFIFSTTNAGHLAVEAITPGRLKDRKTSRIVVNRSTLLTASVFDLFLGDEPLDEEGKKDVGHAMLWAANGFRFRPWEMREGQYIAERGPNGEISFPRPPSEQVALPLRPSVFQLLDEGTQPLCRMLLGAISQAAQREDLAGA